MPKAPERQGLTPEEFLEKMSIGISTDVHQKCRVYKNDIQRVLSKVKELNTSTKKQGLLLLRCCSDLLPDESPTERMKLMEEVWNTLKPHTEFTNEHYNELLRCYIANKRTIKASSFISQMSPVKPNVSTYELILQAICEAGDINQAAEVISNMKALGIAATERIFNSLIIGEGWAGSLDKIEEILTMMKTLKVDVSVDTHTAIAKAYAVNGQVEQVIEQLDKAQSKGFQFQEEHVMELVKALALRGLTVHLPKILSYLPTSTLNSPSISPYMQSVATQLVFVNCPVAALEIYKCLPLPSFGPKDDVGLHGRSLMRDCVKASVSSSVIGYVAHELMSTGRNPIALHNATEAALQLGKTPLALDLLTRMMKLNMEVRPHYFWPILLVNCRSFGEKGIMNTLSTMVTMGVQPDYDTILEYVLPHVSFSSPQNLMKKLLDTGLTVSVVLTPMLHILLSTGQVRSATELCELFEGTIDSEKLLTPLTKGFITSQDVQSTVHMLEELTKKAMQKLGDWTGRYLCRLVNHKNIRQDKTLFLDLVEALKLTDLKISTSATDSCISQLASQTTSAEIKEELRNDLMAITDEHIVDESDMFVSQIPHPKSMDVESLRAHLTELEAKNMNTRGVLRKLLQHYCREGNMKGAMEIVDKCRKEEVFLSAGMKASIFDMHVKLGELELAEEGLAELSKSSPNFTLDEFKVIDLATLMIYRKNVQKAHDLIVQQSQKRRVIGGRNIEGNCWRLLDAMATHCTPKQTQTMFNLLIQYGYCKPTNVILGPLIRVQMKSEDISLAVAEFVRVANKYNRTPLKHELLCRILKDMNDGNNEDTFMFNEAANGRLNKLVQAILAADKKVHGPGNVQLTLISALAEVGYKKSLRKLLLDPSTKIHPEALLRQCERFADENKLAPLEVIAECSKDLRRINTECLYEIMLRVHQRNDDCQSALAIWHKMQEDDVRPSVKFAHHLTSLLHANHVPVPPELLAFVSKGRRKLSLE